MKKCAKCKRIKSTAEFYHRDVETKKRVQRYYYSYCKICHNKRVIKYHKTIKGRAAKKKAWSKWRSGNGVSYMKAYAERWRKNNADRTKEYDKTKYKRHRAKIMSRISEYRVKYPEKYHAHNMARWHFKKAQSCVMCGRKNAHRHHPNYAEPLNIIWLCPKDHSRIHRRDISI